MVLTKSPDFKIPASVLTSRFSVSFEDGGINSSSELSKLARVETDEAGGLSSNSVSEEPEGDVDPSDDSTSASSSHDSIVIKDEEHLQSF